MWRLVVACVLLCEQVVQLVLEMKVCHGEDWWKKVVTVFTFFSAWSLFGDLSHGWL